MCFVVSNAELSFEIKIRLLIMVEDNWSFKSRSRLSSLINLACFTDFVCEISEACRHGELNYAVRLYSGKCTIQRVYN